MLVPLMCSLTHYQRVFFNGYYERWYSERWYFEHLPNDPLLIVNGDGDDGAVQ